MKTSRGRKLLTDNQKVVEVFGDIAGSPYTENGEIITLLLEKE